MEKKTIQMGVKDDVELSGIGGWLIWIAIELILTPFTALINLSKISTISEYTDVMKEMNFPMFYWTVSRVGYTILLVLSVILLVLFFQKRKVYVPLAIGEIIFRMIMVTSLMFIGSGIPGMSGQLVMIFFYGITSGTIWILYYKKSVRVKNTFIE